MDCIERVEVSSGSLTPESEKSDLMDGWQRPGLNSLSLSLSLSLALADTTHSQWLVQQTHWLDIRSDGMWCCIWDSTLKDKIHPHPHTWASSSSPSHPHIHMDVNLTGKIVCVRVWVCECVYDSNDERVDDEGSHHRRSWPVISDHWGP